MLDSGGGKIDEQITPDQILWLYNTYHKNMQVYGPVPSILTFHIPPPEFEDLFNTGQCTGTCQIVNENYQLYVCFV